MELDVVPQERWPRTLRISTSPDIEAKRRRRAALISTSTVELEEGSKHAWKDCHESGGVENVWRSVKLNHLTRSEDNRSGGL